MDHDIVDALLKRQLLADEIPTEAGPGVYAFFGISPGELPGISFPSATPLYVGITDSGLSTRNHYIASHSGFSSPRRTLGALLKSELNLQSVPRSPGLSKTNWQNYRFTDDGENRLTAWMRRNLRYSYVVVDDDLQELERRLVQFLQPPLNLTLWKNPQKLRLQELRAVCKREARSNANASTMRGSTTQ